MKVSVQKVKNLRDSRIIEGYKKVIKEANASQNPTHGMSVIPLFLLF